MTSSQHVDMTGDSTGTVESTAQGWADVASPCRIYDVEVRKNWLWYRVGAPLVVIIVFAALFGVTWLSKSPVTNSWVFMAAAVLFLVSALFLVLRGAGGRRRLDVLLEIARSGNLMPDFVWKEWMRDGIPFFEQNWQVSVANKFAKAGYRNCVIRAFFPGERREIRPIEHPFEPLRPNEDSTEFYDLLCGVFEDGNGGPAAGTEKERFDVRVGPWKRIQRTSVKKRILIQSLAPLAYAFYVAADWLSGRSSSTFAVIFVPILFLLVASSLYSMNPLNGWYLVPGGLYVRSVIQRQMPRLWPRFGAADRVIPKNPPLAKQLLTASGQFLLIVQYSRQHHHVVITDGTSAHTEIMTRKEADLLVSTWISSIKPPEPEWIEKLLEGCGTGTTGGTTSEVASSANGEANANG